jgi:hypothetical protein
VSAPGCTCKPDDGSGHCPREQECYERWLLQARIDVALRHAERICAKARIAIKGGEDPLDKLTAALAQITIAKGMREGELLRVDFSGGEAE